jgi:hypothetical protein
VRVFVGAPLAMLMNVLLNSSPSLIGEHILIRQHDTSDVHCNPCRWRIWYLRLECTSGHYFIKTEVQ